MNNVRIEIINLDRHLDEPATQLYSLRFWVGSQGFKLDYEGSMKACEWMGTMLISAFSHMELSEEQLELQYKDKGMDADILAEAFKKSGLSNL